MLKHQQYPKYLVLGIILLNTLAVPTSFAATIKSAAASSGMIRKMAKYSARHRAKRSAPAGVVFGGVTPTHAPVVIQVSRNSREVVQATMAVPVQCQASSQPSGEPINVTLFLPSRFTHMPISATGAFQKGEEGTGSEEGDTVTITERLSGKFNRARTSVTGTWSIVMVIHDATGATVDQCNSGAVRFTAIQ